MLIVDDLVDTGKTARVVRDLLPKAHFATVYAKPMGRPLVDTFITEVSQDTWIYFPWDTGSRSSRQSAKAGTRARPFGHNRLRRKHMLTSDVDAASTQALRMLAAVAAAAPRALAAIDLCEPADPHSRRLRGRWRRRYRRAAAAGADEGGAGPTDHHREPHRSERDARNRALSRRRRPMATRC